MTRAAAILKWHLYSFFILGYKLKLKNLPRPGYCQCCNYWAWLTNETPAYSAYDGAYICEECAIVNDSETEHAWSEYYSGCL